MQRILSCASVFLASALSFHAAPAEAGEIRLLSGPSHGRASLVQQNRFAAVAPGHFRRDIHGAPQRIKVVRPELALTAGAFANQPVIFGGIQPTPEPARIQAPSAPRALRPLSFNPVDPNAVVTRLPSGRIAISPAPGAYVPTPYEQAYYERRQRPYAPPSFQIIGEPSRRHLDGPVELKYGVQPARQFNPGPKVVWLDEQGRDRHADEHPRHVK